MYFCQTLINYIKMKNLLQTLLGLAGLFGCLYILLASITLLELFLGLR